MLQSITNVIVSVVGPTQLGGWVRAGVAAGFGWLAAKYGMQFWDSADVAGAVGTALATVIVGLWSSLGKTAQAAGATPAA